MLLPIFAPVSSSTTLLVIPTSTPITDVVAGGTAYVQFHNNGTITTGSTVYSGTWILPSGSYGTTYETRCKITVAGGGTTQFNIAGVDHTAAEGVFSSWYSIGSYAQIYHDDEGGSTATATVEIREIANTSNSISQTLSMESS